MAEPKTKETEVDVLKFIKEFAKTEQKIQDSLDLLQLMEKTTGHKPKMWGPTIIGFGKYRYKSKLSKQEGDWPLVGFSPRKSAISLYVFTGKKEHEYLLEKLGKYKLGKACIYINKLSDINQKELIKMIKVTIRFLEAEYGKIKKN